MAAYQSIEQLALVQCTEKLCSGISQDPVKTTLKLFEQSLVSEAQVSASLSVSQDDYSKASALVQVIRRRVVTPEDFKAFLSVLGGCPWLQDVVKAVQEVYDRVKSDTAIEYHHYDLVTVAQENKEKLELAYGFLVADVIEKLEQMSIDFPSFHSHVTTSIRDDQHIIQKASSIADVFQALTRTARWKCDSITALEIVCKKYGRRDPDLMRMIEDYKSELAGFKATTKIIHFMKSMKGEIDESEPQLLSIQEIMAEHDEKYCRTLSVKLSAQVTEKCLDYIDELWASIVAYTYIPDLPVLLKSICDGCIEVTWLIPGRLAREIQTRIKLFNEVAQQLDIITIKLDDTFIYNSDGVTILKEPPSSTSTRICEDDSDKHVKIAATKMTTSTVEKLIPTPTAKVPAIPTPLHRRQDLIADGIVTDRGTIIHSTQITLTVPQGALKPEDGEVEILIHKFDAPFYNRRGHQAASPAFNLWSSKSLTLQKGASVQIKHMALLQNEQDCQKLEFMLALPGPHRTFHKITIAKGTFKPRSPFGEITLDGLACFIVVTVPSDSARDLGVFPARSPHRLWIEPSSPLIDPNTPHRLWIDPRSPHRPSIDPSSPHRPWLDPISSLPTMESRYQLHHSPIEGIISAKGTTLHSSNREITVLVPEGALSQESHVVKLLILKDTEPFQYPAGYQAAGPVYLVKPSKNVDLLKSLKVRMRHFARLRNEEDIKKVTFVSASPGQQWKRLRKITGQFKIESSFGEITLDSLSHFKLTIAVQSDAAYVLTAEHSPLSGRDKLLSHPTVSQYSLKQEDSSQIKHYLKDLTSEELIALGQALGLSRETLLHSNPKTLAEDLIHYWIRQDDDVVEKSSAPTWHSLAEALRDMELTGISNDIQNEHNFVL